MKKMIKREHFEPSVQKTSCHLYLVYLFGRLLELKSSEAASDLRKWKSGEPPALWRATLPLIKL